MADKGCMAKSQMYCCKNIWFLASCSCMHGFYFFILCHVFSAPVFNHSVVREPFICSSKASVADSEGVFVCVQEQKCCSIGFWGSWMVELWCFRTLYRCSVHHRTPKYKLEQTKSFWATVCMNYIVTFFTLSVLCDLVLSVWRHLWKLLVSYTSFLHLAILYTSRHSWCRYNNW